MYKCEKLNNKFLNYGLIFFKTGIFFLASAPIIACLFLIFSLFISFLFNKNILKNKLDYPFLICIPLMMIGSDHGPSGCLAVIMKLMNWVGSSLFGG